MWLAEVLRRFIQLLAWRQVADQQQRLAHSDRSDAIMRSARGFEALRDSARLGNSRLAR